jgi:acyl-CoA synthetase (AMP-forming)/AMP-acid ligase II
LNITEPLRRLARIAPDTVAIIRPDGCTVSYLALERWIDRVVHQARRFGLRPNDIVGLAMTPPYQLEGLVLTLAMARMGVATVRASLPRERLRLRLFESDNGPPLSSGDPAFDRAWQAESPPDEHAPLAAMHADGAAICQILSSSGTTGFPKEIPISHDLLTRRVYGWWLGNGGGTAVRLLEMNLNGSLGLVQILRTLWLGGTVVLPNRKDPAGTIVRHAVTTIFVPPFAMTGLLDALPPGAGRFPTLRTIESGGSFLPLDLAARAAARLCPTVVSNFGATEAGIVASAPVAALGAHPGAVGYVFPGVTVEATADDGTPLPPGTEGLLRMRGDMVASAYLWDDAASRTAFRDGWYYSGDLGTVGPDSMLYLSGRVADVIDVGGQKISPRAIEFGLLALPGIADAAAFGVPDAAGIEQVWAAVLSDSPLDRAALAGFGSSLPAWQAPRAILRLHDLPRSPAGKIHRGKLVALARDAERTTDDGVVEIFRLKHE